MATAHNKTIAIYSVEIPAGRERLKGDLVLPHEAAGIVIFAHGSGSGRNSPRNRHVAQVLQDDGLATLLMDLLSEEEAEDRANVFDISRLADRVLTALTWAASSQDTAHLPVGVFGASTGAAAALVAAAREQQAVKAVVSRGGRPDLAYGYLEKVAAPTLLIVGGDDDACIPLNEEAYALLQCEKKITIVPGATHLFPELGKLEEVARLASDWFTHHLLPKKIKT